MDVGGTICAHKVCVSICPLTIAGGNYYLIDYFFGVLNRPKKRKANHGNVVRSTQIILIKNNNNNKNKLKTKFKNKIITIISW